MLVRPIAYVPLVFAALTLAACAAPQPAAQSGQSGTPQVKQGGVLTLKMGLDPYDWDVTFNGQSTPNQYGVRLAYSTLLNYKVGEGSTYTSTELEPGLTERWEVGPDAKTFTFHLRKGAKFAPSPSSGNVGGDSGNIKGLENGREITSADVKWSYEYSARAGQFKDVKGLNKSPIDFIYEGLDGIDTPDPSTAVVRFKDGFVPFIYYTATQVNPIMAHEIYDQNGNLKDALVGSGPFQLDTQASQKGSRWSFKKNPTYFREGRPYLDEVRFLVLADDATARSAFQTRQLDQDYVLTPREVDEVRKANPNAVVYEYQQSGFLELANSAKPPLGDPRIRKAMSLAIDRDAFIQSLFGGRGSWSLGFVNTWIDLFTEEEVKSFVKYDPAQAAQLVKDAGFPNGFEVDANYVTDNGEASKQINELLQAQLKKAGINLNLKAMSFSEDSMRRRARDFQFTTIAQEYPRAEIDAWLFPAAYKGGGNNYNQIDDPKANDLLLAQRRETDMGKRRELLRQAIRYLNENALAFPTARRSYFMFWQPNIKAYYPHADGGNLPFQGLDATWIDK